MIKSFLNLLLSEGVRFLDLYQGSAPDLAKSELCNFNILTFLIKYKVAEERVHDNYFPTFRLNINALISLYHSVTYM